MVDLIYTELLKLKRSRMFLLSLLGAAVAPVMVVLASYIQMRRDPELEVLFEKLFYDTSLYTFLLIGVPLYAVVTAYLFSREYAEDTLKNLLTLPVTRSGLLLSKTILLFGWVLLLTALSWGLTLLLGLATGFDGLSGALLAESAGQYAVGALLQALLVTPMIFITILSKNYVPAIIASIAVTLVNAMGFNSEDRGLIPWVAAFDIAYDSLFPTYPAAVSYALIAVTSVTGFAAALLYFRRADIH